MNLGKDGYKTRQVEVREPEARPCHQEGPAGPGEDSGFSPKTPGCFRLGPGSGEGPPCGLLFEGALARVGARRPLKHLWGITCHPAITVKVGSAQCHLLQMLLIKILLVLGCSGLPITLQIKYYKRGPGLA